MTECQICCEEFNKSTNTPVTCEYGDCNHVACKSCIRMYLTTTNADPCCMKCNKPYNIAFMQDNLNRSFVSNDYRRHRTQLLLERAISQLPEAMGEVERLVQVEDKKKDISEIRNQIHDLHLSIRTHEAELSVLEDKKQHGAVKRKFVMGCPREECRGFLSSQYKCGLCGYHTCSQCLCVKGTEANTEHECNPDDIASAEMIKSQTKPCPGCGERISKIEGCDQMWCTSCHTAFSWKTGEIDNGVVHNPHFFQYQRTNQGAAAEQGGQGMGQCNANNMPGYDLMRGVENALHQTLMPLGRMYAHKIMMFYRFIAHVRHYEVAWLRNRIRDESDTMGIRVQYLQKRIDTSSMERQLYINDQSRRRSVLILNLFLLIADVGLEWVWGLCNSHASGEDLVLLAQNEVHKMEGMYEYCNREWGKISYDHRIAVPVIIEQLSYQEISCKKISLYRLGKEKGIISHEGDDFHNWATNLYTSDLNQ